MTQATTDASLAERTARLGAVYSRLLILTAGERAYRKAGDQKVASALAAERVDILDELTRTERDDMLLIAIGRAAPPLHLCRDCGQATPHAVCDACTAAATTGTRA